MVLTNLSFSLLVPVQDIVLPHYYGKLIDALIHNKDIKRYITFVITIFVALELGFIISDWHDIHTSAGFQTFARKEILSNVLEKYDQHYSDINIGHVMSKIVKIPYTLVVWYERMKHSVIPYILVFGFAVCYFAKADTFLGLALLITAVLYAFLIIGVPQTYCKNPSKEKDKVVNDIHEQIDDILRNFVAMHGDKTKQQHEIDRLQSYEQLFTVKFAETMKCLMKTKVMTSLIIITFIVTFILRSYHLLQAKRLDTASFSSLFLILTYLCGLMMFLESQLREMIFDWGIISESDELFAKPNQHKHTPMASAGYSGNEVPQTGIGMKNVSFGFPGSSTKILKDITFHVEKGETVVILGNIGSGKSTILKLLLRFIEPDSGMVYVNGTSYEHLSMKQVKDRVGFVPQLPLLFDRTVMENIVYGTSGVTRAHVIEFLQQTGIDKEFKNLKDGVDSKVGKNGSKLSGGQRQIVLCLRVFFQNHDFIIMDEPTASLDKRSKETLKMVLDVIMKNKTVIVVTHDDELLKIANRRIYVENGRVVEKHEGQNTENKEGFWKNAFGTNFR